MTINLVRQERQKVILIVSFGYILPILLVYFQLVPFSWRFYLLILAAIAILIIAKLYKFSPLELGLNRQNLKTSLNAIALPTLACAILMVIYYTIKGPRLDNSAYPWAFYVFFVIISSPIQEFLYRGFLFGIFTRAKLNSELQILLSTCLYSFVHLIYRDIPTLVFTLLIGLYWGYHYAKFRNIYSVTLSHSLLGAIAILVGLV